MLGAVESLPQNGSSRQAKRNATETRQRLRERQRWPPACQVVQPLTATLHLPTLPQPRPEAEPGPEETAMEDSLPPSLLSHVAALPQQHGGAQ